MGFETGGAGFGDDDVIVEADTELFGHLFHFQGHFDIAPRRLGIAGWVIVHHDDRGGAQIQRPFHHFAGIDRGMIDGAGLLQLVGDHHVLLVEIEQAANNGNAMAAFNMGWINARGLLTEDGLMQDKDVAEQWFEKSASNGFNDAVLMLKRGY